MPDDSGRKQLNDKQRKALEEFRSQFDHILSCSAAEFTGPRFAVYVPYLVQTVILKLAKRVNSSGEFEDADGKPITDLLNYAKTILKHEYWTFISSGIHKEDSIDADPSDSEIVNRAARALDSIAYHHFFQDERTTIVADHYRTVLEKLMDRLDDQLRIVVKLRMFDHLEFDQIASVLKIRPDLAKYMMNLGRAKLRYWLKQELRREL